MHPLVLALVWGMSCVDLLPPPTNSHPGCDIGTCDLGDPATGPRRHCQGSLHFFFFNLSSVDPPPPPFLSLSGFGWFFLHGLTFPPCGLSSRCTPVPWAHAGVSAHRSAWGARWLPLPGDLLDKGYEFALVVFEEKNKQTKKPKKGKYIFMKKELSILGPFPKRLGQPPGCFFFF